MHIGVILTLTRNVCTIFVLTCLRRHFLLNVFSLKLPVSCLELHIFVHHDNTCTPHTIRQCRCKKQDQITEYCNVVVVVAIPYKISNMIVVSCIKHELLRVMFACLQRQYIFLEFFIQKHWENTKVLSEKPKHACFLFLQLRCPMGRKFSAIISHFFTKNKKGLKHVLQ